MWSFVLCAPIEEAFGNSIWMHIRAVEQKMLEQPRLRRGRTTKDGISVDFLGGQDSVLWAGKACCRWLTWVHASMQAHIRPVEVCSGKRLNPWAEKALWCDGQNASEETRAGFGRKVKLLVTNNCCVSSRASGEHFILASDQLYFDRLTQFQKFTTVPTASANINFITCEQVCFLCRYSSLFSFGSQFTNQSIISQRPELKKTGSDVLFYLNKSKKHSKTEGQIVTSGKLETANVCLFRV